MRHLEYPEFWDSLWRAQLYTPGRACAWKDVGIDSAGYMATILLAAFVFSVILLVRFVIHKKQAKKKDTDGE